MRRVLVIDDDDDIRMLVRLSLERVGDVEVLDAANGREGLDVARAERPDAILLDVMMPEMDGPTTVHELRRAPETAAIPVVLLTAKVQARDRERFAALPIQGTIPKPFDPLDLPRQLEEMLPRVAEGDALHPEFADLWPESRGRVDARLADLERGVAALEAGTLGEDDRAAARAAAHKLVGTLGTYGLMAAAANLKAIEQAFEDPSEPDPSDLRARVDRVVRAVNDA